MKKINNLIMQSMIIQGVRLIDKDFIFVKTYPFELPDLEGLRLGQNIRRKEFEQLDRLISNELTYAYELTETELYIFKLIQFNFNRNFSKELYMMGLEIVENE